MAVPQTNPGDVLTSAYVDSWCIPLAAYKTGDTSRASTTALTADPDLTLPVAASAVYALTGMISESGLAAGTSDLTFQFTAPAGATLVGHAVFNTVTGTVGLSANFALNATTIGTNTTAIPMFLEATLTTAGTAGTLAFTWAQHVSNVTATVVKGGSRLILQRIG